MDANEAIAKVRAAWSADPEVFVTTSDEARRLVVALQTLGILVDNGRDQVVSSPKARDDEYGS